MGEPEIVSNYTRAEPPVKSPSKAWYLFPTVLLPICIGMFVTGMDAFFRPAIGLGLPVDINSDYQGDVAQTIALLTAIVCGMVISTKRSIQIVKAFASYVAGFVCLGTTYLYAFDTSGGHQRDIWTQMLVSGMLGAVTLIAIVGPGTLILSMFVWMFRTAVEPARKKVPEEALEPARHRASMEAMIEARQQKVIESHDHVTVSGVPVARN